MYVLPDKQNNYSGVLKQTVPTTSERSTNLGMECFSHNVGLLTVATFINICAQTYKHMKLTLARSNSNTHACDIVVSTIARHTR